MRERIEQSSGKYQKYIGRKISIIIIGIVLTIVMFLVSVSVGP